MEDFTIIFYDLPDGTEPAKNFLLEELDEKMRSKMLASIRQLEKEGNNLRMPHSKYLKDGIFELRARSKTDISRVLYFFVIGRNAVLTHGFIKKTEKTPIAEIERAKKYQDEYATRRER